MTCKEKLAAEHPDRLRSDIPCGCSGCPQHYGYLNEPEYCAQGPDSCNQCWDREIPGTLPMQYPIDTAAEAELAKPEPQWTKDNPYTRNTLINAAERMASHLFGDVPTIKDSGDRTEFATGAVRDMREGKGRCDLMPLEVVAKLMCTHNDTTKPDLVTGSIALFKNDGYQNTIHLYNALLYFSERYYNGHADMFLEVAKHFDEGAKKYGENNWQKGIPVHCYIDSAVRHYLKWLRGDKDEPHDRAFVWNLMCCIWEVDYHEHSENGD